MPLPGKNIIIVNLFFRPCMAAVMLQHCRICIKICLHGSWCFVSIANSFKVRHARSLGFFYLLSAICSAQTVEWVLLSKKYIEFFLPDPPFP